MDHIVEGVIRLDKKPPNANLDWSPDSPDPASSAAPCKIYNIGNYQPAELMMFIEAIEKASGVRAIKEYLLMQPGEVPAACADGRGSMREMGFRAQTSIKESVKKFIDWYTNYYRI